MHTSRIPSSGFRKWLSIPLLMMLFAAIMIGTAHAAPLEATWKLSQEGDLQPLDWRLTLEFNRPVSVLELSKKIKCLTASATTMFTVINATDTASPLLSQPLPSERTRFILGPKSPAKNLNDCLITIAEGLSAAGGEPLASAVQVKFECRDTVDVLSVEPFYTADEGRGIAVTVSKPIDAAALKRKLRILPPIGRINSY